MDWDQPLLIGRVFARSERKVEPMDTILIEWEPNVANHSEVGAVGVPLPVIITQISATCVPFPMDRVFIPEPIGYELMLF